MRMNEIYLMMMKMWYFLVHSGKNTTPGYPILQLIDTIPKLHFFKP